MNKRGYLSLMQIFILVFGVVAIAYALGSEVKVVSSAEPDWDNLKEGDVIYDGGEGDWIFSGGKFRTSEYGGKELSIDEMKNAWKEGFQFAAAYVFQDEKKRAVLPDHSPTSYKISKVFGSVGGVFSFSERSRIDNLRRLAKDNTATTYDFTYEGKEYQARINNKGGVDYYQGKNKVEDKETISRLDTATGMASVGLGATLTSGDFWIKGVGGNLFWAVATYGTIKTLGSTFLGLDEEETDAFSLAASTGLFVGKTVTDVLMGTKFSGSAQTWGVGAGLITAAVIYYATYEDKSQIIITYTCAPWEAPTGGENCELCNKQEIPCSEYQCKSLGQACELLNPNTNETVCAWVNKNDAKYPIITLNKKVLTPGCEYSNTASISPPDRGVKILYTKGEQADTSGCIPPFTPIQFGITTDEPSKCKISTERKKSFDDMGLYFGGSSTFKYNHTQILILPDPNKLGEGIEIKNNGEFSLYVRCADANGNYNPANYVFRYCVQKGPDLTAPIIRKTSLESGTPIAYNTSSIKMYLYTNEPATCKWDYNDKKYEAMQYEMESNPRPNKELLYTSSGEITGIRNDAITSFYFRCKDSAGNSNQQSKKIDLIGTMPLKINSVEPNNTIIKDSVSPARVDLVVKTTGGYEGGKSICYYSASGNDGDYEQFGFNGEVGFKTINTQDIYLPAGDKTYYIKCIDKAGNEDVKKIQFTVDEDKSPPQVARIYKEGGYLKLITNEKSSCVYDTKTCNYRFEQGINMSRLGEDKHFVDWDTNTNFYIKCQDEFKNRPSPSECTIIVKPTKTLKQT